MHVEKIDDPLNNRWAAYDGDILLGEFYAPASCGTPEDAIVVWQTIVSGFLPTVSVNDVKAEAQRRIISLTGAPDLQSCLIKQLNANMRANELNDKRLSGSELNTEEAAEAAALRGLAESIKSIRAVSNVIEAMSPIPADFSDDAYWA